MSVDQGFCAVKMGICASVYLCVSMSVCVADHDSSSVTRPIVWDCNNSLKIQFCKIRQQKSLENLFVSNHHENSSRTSFVDRDIDLCGFVAPSEINRRYSNRKCNKYQNLRGKCQIGSVSISVRHLKLTKAKCFSSSSCSSLCHPHLVSPMSDRN